MINIGILQRRRDFIDLQLKLLSQSKYLDEINVCILTQSNTAEYYANLIDRYNFNSEILGFGEHDNFMSKIRYLISLGGYSIKMDEDSFISAPVLDFMIDNINTLDENLLITPSFITGVPSFEFVYNDLMDAEDKLGILDILLRTPITRIGNLICPDAFNNEELGKYYLDLNGTYPHRFFDTVRKIPHVYKGIHPIRINYYAQLFMLLWMCDNIDLFMNNNYYLYNSNYEDYPYLCNHIHLIKAEEYNKAINQYPHCFDEVSLNLYRQNNDLNFTFVRNCAAIQIMYSNVTEHPNDLNPCSSPQGNDTELEMYKEFSRLINERIS